MGQRKKIVITGYKSYFYIIKHKVSGKYYAGARSIKGCDFNELLKDNGYKTSSKIVKKIIDEEGIDAFEINRVRTFLEKEAAYEYETRFLYKVDAMRNSNFLNRSNNTPACVFDLMRENNRKITCLKRYGVEHSAKHPSIYAKTIATNIAKYGFDNPSKHPDVISKINTSIQESLGVDWAMQSEQTKLKSINTCILKYGVSHPSKTKEFQDAKRKSNLEKYGVEHINKLPERKEAKLKRDSIKRSRQIVTDIKKLQSFLNIRIGRGWDLKSDENIKIVFDDLYSKFSERLL